MPRLKNPRHERFATLVAGGMSASEAYRNLGCRVGKNANVHSARWMARDSIRARVNELQSKVESKTLLTMQLKRETLALIATRPTERSADRIAAIMADAKLAGELREKVEVEASDELAAFLASLRVG